MKRILFLFLVLLPGLLFAGNVPEELARKMAVAFWQSAPQTRGASPSFQMVLNSESAVTRSSGEEPAFYVFDNTSGPGFVIVAGDDIAMPVLAYSFEHEFSADEMPPNLQDWLTHIRGEINQARQQNVQASDFVSHAWTATRAGAPVVQLETALWDQSVPYNAMCPWVNRLSTYTGCTATAVAIAMRYHQWPERGVGTLPAYTTATYQAAIEAIPLGHTYDWANMRMEYPTGNYTQAEADAVATLMRDCAVGLQSDFGPFGSDGTGAYLVSIPDFLTTYMGYDASCRVVNRDLYATDEWHQIMRNELNNRRPIIYGGQSNEGGHAFVLDGYDSENYFSVNWGWGGMSNGYFLLSALDPAQQGAGGSDSGFNRGQQAVINMQKDVGGSPVYELCFVSYINSETGEIYNGLSIPEGETIVQGQPFVVQMGLIMNSGNVTFTGDFKLAVTDKEGNIVEDEILLETLQGIPAYAGIYGGGEVTVNVPILPGYRLRGYYKSETASEWALVKGNEEQGVVWDLLIADEYTIEETTQLTYNKKSRLFTLQVKDGVTATLTGANGSDHSDLCQPEGNQITIDASTLPGGAYKLTLRKGGEEKVVNLSLPAAE